MPARWKEQRVCFEEAKGAREININKNFPKAQIVFMISTSEAKFSPIQRGEFESMNLVIPHTAHII
jgi:hypothetical protein